MTGVRRWTAGCLVALVVTTVLYFAPEREVAVTTVAKPETAELAAPGSSQREERDALDDPRREKQEEAEREVKLAEAKLQTAKAELAEAKLELAERKDLLSKISTSLDSEDPDRKDKVAMMEADIEAGEAMVEIQEAIVGGREAELRIAERKARDGEVGTAV